MSVLTMVRRVLAVGMLALAVGLSVHLIVELNRVKQLKTDLADINNVRYGLMDARQWVTQIADVLERRILEFEVTESNRPQIRRAIEGALHQILDVVDAYLADRGRPRAGEGFWDSVGRALQRGVQELVLDIDELRPQVPQFAELILTELAQPEARRALKNQLIGFLDQATDSAFSPVDRASLAARLRYYGCTDTGECSARLEGWIAQSREPLLLELIGLFLVVVTVFLLVLLPDRGRARTAGGARLDGLGLAVLTGATLMLLAGGLLTPMIEIDARIADFRMGLMGESIQFSNQVLYFQSKSVFDVVSLLVGTQAADMILVALLLVVFSVLFPLAKVLATFAYFSGGRAASSPVVEFFALRSAKWSMADVFVISTFMAYIGFSGLVGSQLGALRRAARSVDIMTTDGTLLAPGFYLFLGFVIASLVVSTFLDRGGHAAAPSRDRAAALTGHDRLDAGQGPSRAADWPLDQAAPRAPTRR